LLILEGTPSSFREMGWLFCVKCGGIMIKSKLFKAFFYQSRIPQLITTIEVKNLQFNEAFGRFVGYSLDELYQMSIQDFSHPEDYKKDVLLAKEIMNGKRTEYEMEKRYIHKSGIIKTGVLNVSLINDEDTGEAYLLGQIIDVTEKVEMSRSLMQSEQQYRLLAVHSMDLVMAHNIDSSYRYISPVIKTFMGYDIEDMISMTPYDFIHPMDVSSMSEEIEFMLSERKPITSTYRGRKKDGTYIWLESIIKPVIDESTEIISEYISVTRNIQKRVETSEMLRKSEKLAVLGQMAAAVAHEIRNPLTPIKGFLQLLSTEKNLNPIFVTIILDELKRIEIIISEFLSMAKPHTEKETHVIVDDLVKQVIQLHQTQALMRNKEINLYMQETIPPIMGDPNSLKQVFVNVIQNALDAIEEKGEISIKTYMEDQMVCVEIEDNGCGIPINRISKLGEPFYSTKEKGTGLGLMTSFKIIEDHHGEINVVSAEGEGTKVRIRLPLPNVLVKD
jgi:two-component system, sporulation sensor kinase A